LDEDGADEDGWDFGDSFEAKLESGNSETTVKDGGMPIFYPK
jgi:hypothetical protein